MSNKKNNMKNLKTITLTGLTLALAGIIGFFGGCSKKQEISESNYRVSSAYTQYCLNKRDIQRDSNILENLKSEKNYDKSDIGAFNFLRTAYLKDLQGFPDSTEIYFDKMIEEIKSNNNLELKDASTLMLLLGPGYYYFNQRNLQKAEEVLDLARSRIADNTPKNYLRSLFECLGDSKRNLGKSQEARESYSLALKYLNDENLTKDARKRIKDRLKSNLTGNFERYQAAALNREIDNIYNHFAFEGRLNKNNPEKLLKLDEDLISIYYDRYDSCLHFLARGIIKEAQGKNDSAAFFYSKCIEEMDKRKAGGFILERGGASLTSYGPLRFYSENPSGIESSQDSVFKYLQRARQLENNYTPKKVKEYLKRFKRLK